MSDEMTNDELPEGWAVCEIGEISPVVGGGTPPSKNPANFTTNGGIPWVTPADLSGYSEMFISYGSRNLTKRGFSESSAKMLPSGAILFSSRAPVGYVAIASNPVCTNQGFKSFVLPQGFDPRFGYFYLRHIKPLAEARATGTTFKELSGGAAAKLPFLVAPLAEQKRIADKLESVLGRVDACRARLDRVPALLKRFRQSVLAAATSGKLTEQWRLSNGVSDAWENVPLGSIVDEIKNGLSPKPKEQPPGSPILRISSVRPFQVHQTDIRYLPSSVAVEPYRLRIGDLLFTRYNGSLEFVGVCGLVRTISVKGLVYPDKLIRVRVNRARVVPDWIEIAANSPQARDVIENKARTSAGQTGISGKDLKELLLPFPPLPEQQEIVRRVEALFAFADRVETRLTTAQKTVERLTPATLAKAFRGELVPHDSNDEPASALLERLRSAEPASSATKTHRKRSATA